MESTKRKTKRERVSKGPYNKYLREKQPLEHAPVSSRRDLLKNSLPATFSQDNQLHIEDNELSEVGNVFHKTFNDNDASECQDMAPNLQSLDLEDSSVQASKELDRNIVIQHSNTEEHVTDDELSETLDTGLEIHNMHNVSLVGDGHVDTFENTQELYEMNHELAINLENLCLNEDYNDAATESNTCLNSEAENVSDEGHNPIYSGATLKLGASMLLIITFALKYSLTGEGLCDLLNLINLHCPSENILPQTIRQFRKWFQDIKHPLKIHKYCDNCHMLLNETDFDNGSCPNEKCNKSINNANCTSQFIEIPIAEQIKAMFARPSFVHDIHHRFRRKKENKDTIEDIYDGDVYKSLSSEGGILHNPYNLSLLWNTDGIPCFKSSNTSLWPLYFQINELPFKKRSSPDNMILGGLWLGSSKPTIMSFTEPFVSCLQDLEKMGVEIEMPDSTTFVSKVVVIGGTADLPARSLVCNSMQFNGKFGCSKCLQPGITHKTSQRGHVHIFPFNADCPDGPGRTHEGTVEDSKLAVANGIHSHGIKGPSFLQCLSHYNLITGICIDYMHGVLLGVTKLLLSLWFSSDHSSNIFSMSCMTDFIDWRLKHIKPPNSITRVPRSIREHLKYWKASELKNWLLYYSLPILWNVQNDDYYQHYLLFVNAIYLLLQDKISIEDLCKADRLLKHFCCLFPALYGERYMTCNLHQLLHLPQMVKDMGPLWAYSCFPFENANGRLLKLFHGTQNIDVQIAQTVSIMQRLPNLKYQYLQTGSAINDFYESLTGSRRNNDALLSSDNADIYAVGGTSKKILSEKQLHVVSEFLGHVPTNYITFNRIRIEHEIYHSRCYSRAFCRNSFTIAFEKNGVVEIGQIEFYIQLYPYCLKHGQISLNCQCLQPVNAAVVSHMQSKDIHLSKDTLTNADTNFIKTVSQASSDDILLVPLDHILYKCVNIDIVDDRSIVFACKMPNYIEQD